MKYGNTVVEMRQSYSGLVCSVTNVKWYYWVIIWWLCLSLSSVQAATDCTYPTPQNQIPQAECQALMDLYNSTGGPSWTDAATNNWNVTNTPCSWTGVICGGGNVIKISRSGKNLVGTLPASLSALTSLQILDLCSNQLTGTIPALPASLQSLLLCGNQLTGTIPDLSALTSLQWLSLTSNQLTGSIPDLSALTSLQYLDSDSNQLTGSIPDLSALTSLRQLTLSYNQLTGDLSALSTLTSLTGLDLSSNQLTGDLSALSTLTSLTYLTLSYNQLTGDLSALSTLTSLINLYLGGNQLTGTIPALPNSLQYLNLSGNQLTGTIPALPNSLQYLNLSGNQLTGDLSALSTLTSLTDLTLSYNQLTGDLSALSTLTSLINLYLGGNQLTGTIPALPASLIYLWLNNNQLSGTIPDLSGTALTIGYVDLSCNLLTSETGTSATDRDPDWATTQCFPSPIAPTNLTATTVSQSQIDLSWTDNSSDETGFKIESPAGTLINTTAANAISYSHTGLTCGTTYTYSVIATNAYGDSAPITASATTQACPVLPPTAPSGLTVTAISQNQIDLSWTDNSSDETGFKIESPIGIALTTTEANITIYSHTGLTCNTTYTYSVIATNANGDSSAITGSATTQACPVPLPTYTLTIRGMGKGTGTIGYQLSDIQGNALSGITPCSDTQAGCTYSFSSGTWVKLTATPNADAVFSGFAGNVGDCLDGLLFVTQTATCNAYFDLKPIPVEIPPPSTTTPPDTTTPPSTTTPGTTEGQNSPTPSVEPVVEPPPVEPEIPVTEQPPTPVEPTTPAVESPPMPAEVTPVPEQPPAATNAVTPIMPQAFGIEDGYGDSNTAPDMPTNDIFLVLIHTQLGQVGRKLTIDAPEQLVVTAKVRPYHKHLGQRADIIALYHWTPDGQTQPTVFTIRIKTHIKLVDDMEITIFRGILYDLYGTFRANLYYQLEDGTRIGTEHAATLKINKNHLPTDILLSNHTVKKGSSQDTVIGTLSTIDEDRGGGELPPLYGLVDDAGGRFAVRNDQLVIRRAWLVKQAGSYPIIVRSIDTLGEYIDKPFTIEVTD